ncbi:MAG: uroporphyrinogen-III synthase [Alphaproteobacteria bacterium]
MRVLVTRPIKDGTRTVERLKELGIEAVLIPVTAIRETRNTVPLTKIDAVLISSANAIRYLPDNAGAQLINVPTFCVGEKTASVARDAGFLSVTTGTGDGRALVGLVASKFQTPASLLYLTGTPRKPFIEDGLKANGFQPLVVELYQTVSVDPWPGPARLGVENCDYGLHFSRASVEALLKAAENAGLSHFLRTLNHLCLSEDVATPLREAGHTKIRVAPKPTEEDLLALLHIKET